MVAIMTRATIKTTKKADINIFMVVLLIATLVSIVLIFIILNGKLETMESRFPGQSSVVLYNTVKKGESLLFYVDKCAEYAAKQSVFDFANKSGFSYESPCGKFNGMNIWYKTADLCIPEDINAELKVLFAQNIEKCLATYPEQKIETEYDYSITDGHIVGISREEISISGETIRSKQLITPLLPTKSVSWQECAETEDLTIDIPQIKQPDRKAKLWIPAKARCGGEFPLLILLHGHGSRQENRFIGKGTQYEFDAIASSMIQNGEIGPVMLVAPVSPGVSPENIWAPDKFDPTAFIASVEKELEKYSIKVSIKAALGHSAANCWGVNGGLGQLAKALDLYFIGFADGNCITEEYVVSKSAYSSNKNAILFHMTDLDTGGDEKSFDAVKGDAPIDDLSNARLSFYKEGYSNNGRQWYTYVIDRNKKQELQELLPGPTITLHSLNVPLLFMEAMPRFFSQDKAFFKSNVVALAPSFPKYMTPEDESQCLLERYGSYALGSVKLEQVVIGGKAQGVNTKMAEALKKVAQIIESSGYKVHNWHSCRSQPEMSSCGRLHPACLAVDINAHENPHCPNVADHKTWWKRTPSLWERERCRQGMAVGDIPIEIIKAFEDNGFFWGGRFKEPFQHPDTMHFEFVTECCKRVLMETLDEVFIRTNYVITPQSIFAQYPRWEPERAVS